MLRSKFVGMFLAVVFTLSLLITACGGQSSPAGTGGSDSQTGGSSQGEKGESAADFYKGKSIRLIVPYNPGGGFDVYVRAVAKYLDEQLPDTKVVVENIPGGGSIIGTNEIFTADPDGLTFGLINYPGVLFAELTGKEGVKFDNTKWSFLGRVAAVSPVVYVSEKSQFQTAEDLINASGTVKFGLGGTGSDAYYGTILLTKSFGIQANLVTGYGGSGEADLAVVAGEVDVSFNSVESAWQLIENGDVRPLIYIGNERYSELPDVPTAIELGKDEQQKKVMQAFASIYELERVFVGPAGIPEDRLDYVREALWNAMNDPDFQREMEEGGRSLNLLDSQKTQELANSVSAVISDLKPLLEGAE